MDISEISPEIKDKLIEIKALSDAEGIDFLNAEFTGSSDEFDGVHGVSARGVGETSELLKASAELADLFTDLVDMLIDEKIEGFWNGDGGRGSVDLCWSESTLTLTFAYYTQDTEYFHYTVTAEEDEELKALFDEHTPKELNGDNTVCNINFEGYGDSGCSEHVDSEVEAFEEWCDKHLEEHLPGWEINDGGGGNYSIDFETRTVTAELFSHEQTESDDDVYPFDISNLGQVTQVAEPV